MCVCVCLCACVCVCSCECVYVDMRFLGLFAYACERVYGCCACVVDPCDVQLEHIATVHTDYTCPDVGWP